MRITSAEATIGARLTRRACEGSGNPQSVGNERVWIRQIAEDAIGVGLGHVPHFGRPARKMDRLIWPTQDPFERHTLSAHFDGYAISIKREPNLT